MAGHFRETAGTLSRTWTIFHFSSLGTAKLYAPLWRSIDGGNTFQEPISVIKTLSPEDDSEVLDKPSLAVDNFPGEGNGNVFAAIGRFSSGDLIVCGSSPGGTNWQVIQSHLGTNAAGPLLAVTPAHEICLAWGGPGGLYFTKAINPWTNFPAPSSPIVAFTNNPTEPFQLLRSNFADDEDYLRNGTVLSMISNPAITNHLYLVYHDAETNGAAHPNIYFLQSTDGGSTWTNRIRVNSNTNDTDQWQPVATVHPDGSKIFIAWYDRREDATSNSLIRTYGAFADLPITSSGKSLVPVNDGGNRTVLIGKFFAKLAGGQDV